MNFSIDPVAPSPYIPKERNCDLIIILIVTVFVGLPTICHNIGMVVPPRQN